MEQSIVRVLAVAPYEALRTPLIQAADAFPHLRLDVVVGDLEEGAAIVRQLHAEKYDAIISRGGTAEMIGEVAPCPVIEIEVTFYDVLRSIKLAENYTKQFAIVGFPGITEPAHVLSDLLQYNIRIVTIHNPQDAQVALNSLRQEGYPLVLCDMVTHTAARKLGFDAFLITSGAESLRAALKQAEARGRLFSQNRQEKKILRSLLPSQNSSTLVLRKDGTIYLAVPETLPDDFLSLCREKLTELERAQQIHFYYKSASMLLIVSASVLNDDGTPFYVFSSQPTQIQLRSGQSGIYTVSKPECEHLFMNSFYSISGAMGELEQRIGTIAASHQPVIIMGEPGTGKEQIARTIYLRSQQTSRPFVVVNCSVMDKKAWDYLLGNHNSPLVSLGSTIYFQHMEDMPSDRAQELLSVILETGLSKRTRLIFSCRRMESAPVPDVAGMFAFRLGCLSEYLPAMRRRSDEIPSLAIRYLNSLNFELGKQIAGFEPQAMEQLQHYEWPNNYTQFKQVLHELAMLTTSAYIHSSLVAELLTKERNLTRGMPASASGISTEGRTLDEITYDIILQTLAEHNGNQSSAARQLGISRSTLWRYLGRNDTTPQTIKKKT